MAESNPPREPTMGELSEILDDADQMYTVTIAHGCSSTSGRDDEQGATPERVARRSHRGRAAGNPARPTRSCHRGYRLVACAERRADAVQVSRDHAGLLEDFIVAANALSDAWAEHDDALDQEPRQSWTRLGINRGNCHG